MLKLTLVEEARHWYRLWSVRLAAVFGAMIAAVVYDPGFLTGLVALLPPEWRPVASLLIGLLVTVLPSLARLAKQDKLPEKTGGSDGTA